jgi:tetratricopeptide (TPR) repeat protein
MAKKQPHPTSPPESEPQASVSRRVPLWLALVLPVLAVLVFFLLLEGGLAIFGVQPASQSEDPFVGFAASPLFVPASAASGETMMTTAPNKKDYFNRQNFPEQKAPGSYRIFCLGGSTTYGRPYDDTTSFAGWLRELLPAADKDKNWEVINAGGISYASYRVAKLMEELIRYQPDLFIIYTGHNEFLEERTYRELREIPTLVRSAASLLSHTRTWSAMKGALQVLNIAPQIVQEDRFRLGAEVGTILDQSAGPERYSRDDELKKNILKHYRISLEQMVALARSAGAQVIFVAPASNLKDCSPFKSQHTDGISKTALQRSEDLQAMSKPLLWEKDWDVVLNLLNQAMKLDPRSASLQYSRGQTLLALGRYQEAKIALRIARDEDVCPLRALTSMDRIIAAVAREQQVPLVDFKGLLENRMKSAQGHTILGREYFLDHVHPTIEGDKILALALLKSMVDQGVVLPGADWGEKAIAAVAAKIEGSVDQAEQGRALANLARVLLWAGKNDDAARLARQAVDTAGEYQQVAINAVSTLATAYVRNEQPGLAVKQLYAFLEKAPSAVELRLKLGEVLLNRNLRNLEEAAANLLLVIQQKPYYDWAYALYGIDMAERGRPRIAYSSLTEALRLNPNNSDASRKLAQINQSLAGVALSTQALQVQLESYPSSAPRKLVQGRLDSQGHFIPEGIEAEFYENGRLKRFIDIEQGNAKGVEMTWDKNGKLLSRQIHP